MTAPVPDPHPSTPGNAAPATGCGPDSAGGKSQLSDQVSAEQSTPANDAAVPGNRLDQFAITMSGVCLVHCLAIPVSVLMLPALGEPLLGTETLVHWILLALAIPISMWALSVGYRRHRYAPSLAFGATGLMLMFLGVAHVFGHALELPLTIVGVLLVLVAHVQNLRRHANH